MTTTPAPERHSDDVAQHLFPINDLRHYPENARRHDDDRTRSSLREFGQVECLVGNKGTYTGRPNEVLGGNGRLDIMIEDGWIKAGVTWVDLDETRARALNLRLNPRNGHDPGYDPRGLAEQLAALEADIGLAGYDADDLTDLERLLAKDAESAGEGGDGDGPLDDDAPTQRGVLISCSGADHQDMVFMALKDEGYDVRTVEMKRDTLLSITKRR